MKFKNRKAKSGFTLVETMITVTIIGLLTSLSVPAVMSAKDRALAASLASDFRTYASVFELHSLEFGTWPENSSPGEIPDEMVDKLPRFSEETYQNGKWDWEHDVSGITAGIGLRLSSIDTKVLTRIDEILDDGNLASGSFREIGDGVTFVLQE